MNKLKKRSILLLCLLPIALQAQEEDPIFDDIEADQHIPRKGENTEPKKLTQDGMPVRPLDQNLRKLKIRGSTVSYYVDLASISSSKKDNIARLVTVAISQQGARTLSYEGFDCGYKRYMPYGYAGSDGEFRLFKDQIWQPVIDTGKGRYRAVLIDNYLCGGFSYAVSREKILVRMNGLKPYKNKK